MGITTKNQHKIITYVLNWNQAELTSECVHSLLSQTFAFTQTIVIIDNGSTDDSVHLLKKEFPGIEIIENSQNLGFQGGMNSGIKHALTQDFNFVLLINNDTVAAKDMVEELLINLPEDAGLVSPMLYYFDSKDEPWSIGGKINPILLEVFGGLNKGLRTPEDVLERDFLPSCAWLISREVIEKVGHLDENFFPIYYDDLDYCLRVRREGYKIYLIPQAKLWHKVSQSMGGQHSPKERYLMARNSAYYFKKHMKVWQAPLIFLYRAGSLFLWTLRLAFKGNFIALKSYWTGFIEGWFQSPKSE